MRNKKSRWSLSLLGLLAILLQGCLGIGGSGSANSGTGGNGHVSGVANAFAGKIYATSGHNLYVITGDGKSQQILGGGNIYDPAISPDGTKIAFIQKYEAYSNLDYTSITGGTIHVLLSGNGKFFANSAGFIHSSYHWFSEPEWSPDGSSLIVLSDWMKMDYDQQCTNEDADMLDLQVFSLPFKHPTQIQAIAYAQFGGGGNSDPTYRPGNAGQILYTNYASIPSGSTNQVIQLYMADPEELARHPSEYCMGGKNSGMAISSSKDQDIQPAFSADGNSIAYIKINSSTQMSLNVMPTPGDITQNLNASATKTQALQPYMQSVTLKTAAALGRPTWSPDDKQMAYITDTNDTLDLWVINLSHNTKTGTYSSQGTPVQITNGGIDGDSRIVWMK